MSFNKKFLNKSPIKKHNNENPIVDYLKKAGKSIALGPAGVLIEQGGNFIKNQLAGNIRPYAYNTKGSSTVERIAKSMFTPERGSLNKSGASGALAERQDLLNIMMKGTTPNKSINISNYKPSKSKDKNAVYYSSSSTEEMIKNKLKDPNFLKSFDNKGKFTDYHTSDDSHGDNVLGNFTMHKGLDKDGRRYISYYDKWDLNPFRGNGIKDKLATKAQDLIGVKPAEVYGRVYIDGNRETLIKKKMQNKNKL
jgi:hypothetical protein